MLKPKKKITKQDLKEDKLVKTTLQVKTYLEENSKQVFYVVFAVFAVLAIIIIYRYYHQRTSQEASIQLGMAQIEYSNGIYDQATGRLHTLISEFKDTDEAKQGLFLLADITYQQKNYKQAMEYFQEFVDSYSGSNILLASGYAGLAACYDAESNFALAGQFYAKAAKVAGEFTEADDYYYLAGLCYQKAGEIEKAKQQYEILAKEAKSAKRSKDAEVQLMLLNKTAG